MPRDGILVHESVAAEDLRSIPRVVHRRVGCRELRDRRLRAERAPLVAQTCGMQPRETRRVHARLHARDHELDRLLVATRIPVHRHGEEYNFDERHDELVEGNQGVDLDIR